MAFNIAKNPKLTVKSCKKAINEGFLVDIDKGIKIEEKLICECFDNPDRKERMKKFLERGKNKQNSGKKNLNEVKKEEKEELPMPKGELVPTDKFKNMTYLKEITKWL